MDIKPQLLWRLNTPSRFWLCRQDLREDLWQEAIKKAIPILSLGNEQSTIESILALTLGEGRFGPNHWELGYLKRAYYLVKAIIPRSITRKLRQIYSRDRAYENWPIESRYVYFLWEVLRQLILQTGKSEITIRSIWPNKDRFALCLTHDVETASGQEFVKVIADLEESLGFHSLFNFVPERYEINYHLINYLRQQGFEVGVHGLHHDGRLFSSKAAFMQKAGRINRYVKEWEVKGFRAELTLRQPEWMQALEIEYDLSFFDTDPFEPIPGGSMSIWPFYIGHFIELPYTLVQDYTLTSVLGQNSPRIWLEKVDFIEKFHGMALVNTHPDYLKSQSTMDVYLDFLKAMKMRKSYWQALPGEIARWWKFRAGSISNDSSFTFNHTYSKVIIQGENIQIES
jgi:hypothetical protein